MPYCKSCGAYIPDGLSACLACGYDENAKEAAAAAAKKAEEEAAEQRRRKQEQEEYARREREEQRRRQQEQNRQWAEQEKARRERQQENRQWAQEEYARRQAEREEQQGQADRGSVEAEKPEDQHTDKKSGNHGLAALSYLSFFFALPFFFTPEDEYAKFHAKQGLRLFIFGAVADVVAKILPFGWIFSLFRVYCFFKGINNALNGKEEPLPYIGTIGDK